MGSKELPDLDQRSCEKIKRNLYHTCKGCGPHFEPLRWAGNRLVWQEKSVKQKGAGSNLESWKLTRPISENWGRVGMILAVKMGTTVFKISHDSTWRLGMGLNMMRDQWRSEPESTASECTVTPKMREFNCACRADGLNEARRWLRTHSGLLCGYHCKM
jgi:hypothetical protein